MQFDEDDEEESLLAISTSEKYAVRIMTIQSASHVGESSPSRYHRKYS